MIMDDIIEENIALQQQNAKLKRELRRYRKSLWSALNILDPDQRGIIKQDLIHLEIVKREEYAQSEF